MKKVNWGYLLKVWGIATAIEVALMILMWVSAYLFLNTNMVNILLMIEIAAAIYVLVSVPGFTRKRLTKHAEKLEETFSQHNFNYNYQFGTHNAIYYIDVQSGRLAVIWKYNPTELQFMDASKMEDIVTKDGRGLTGGTNLVSCCFKIDGKKIKIHTLRVSGRSLHMKAAAVLEAISKADALCEQLKAAKQAACKR